MVGMNAVVLDDAVIGAESIVGALSLVRAQSEFAPRSLILGQPATVKGEVSDRMIEHKTEGTALYQALPQDCHDLMEEVKPLTSLPEERIEDFPTLDTWQSRRQEQG